MRKKFITDNLRRLILILMMTAMLFSFASPFVSAAETNGTCGNGVSWSLTASGVLTVSGNGTVQNYSEAIPAPWYDFREDIRVIIVESGVTTIGAYAFYGLEAVTTVTLPSSVKTIASHAFYQCTALKNVSLGSNLATIGESAFECCESLKNIRLPSSVQTIGKRAFYRCYALQTISIPNSVTKIGNMTFAYCSGLISAEIRADISTLPTWMFYDCENLYKVTLADNIVHADRKAFYLCENLSGIYTIEQNADALLADVRGTSIPDFDEDFITTIPSSTNGSVSSSEFEITEDVLKTTTTTVTTTDNSTLSSTVTNERNYTLENEQLTFIGDPQISVTIEAVLENKDGWSELVEEIKEGEKENLNDNQIKVDVSLNDTQEIAGETLNDLAGKNVHVTIDMKDGSTVKIDCTRLEVKEEKKTEEKYELSYTLTPNTDPTKSQIKTLGDAQSYLLSFDGSADFDFSPKIYIGKDKAYSTATLYQNVPGRGLSFLQSVVVDKSGYATFYLQSTKASTEYVIGLNVTAVDASSAIIPEDIAAEYGDVMYYESIQYVTTGVRLFMGLSLFQFAIAVLCVMLFLFLIVGIVMGVVYRKKKLEMYYQLLKERQA